VKHNGEYSITRCPKHPYLCFVCEAPLTIEQAGKRYNRCETCQTQPAKQWTQPWEDTILLSLGWCLAIGTLAYFAWQAVFGI